MCFEEVSKLVARMNPALICQRSHSWSRALADEKGPICMKLETVDGSCRNGRHQST